MRSDDPDDIWLPPCSGLMGNELMEREVQKVIERGMLNGVHIRIVNNNILVSRFCMLVLHLHLFSPVLCWHCVLKIVVSVSFTCEMEKKHLKHTVGLSIMGRFYLTSSPASHILKLKFMGTGNN